MIVEDFERPSDDEIAALREINPNDLGHHAHFGHSSPQVKFMRTSESARVVGPALTVRIPPMDGTMVHKATELARPGDVIVVDVGGHETNACWGDVTSHAAVERGVEAAVIDGAITDSGDIEEIDFPTFARARSNRTVQRMDRCLGGDVNVPVQAGGAVVNPGDVAVGNEDGVLFVPREEIDHALDLCAGNDAREADVIERLRNGESLADISGANDRIARMEEE
jgi:regulator of RNase E activity RraA